MTFQTDNSPAAPKPARRRRKMPSLLSSLLESWSATAAAVLLLLLFLAALLAPLISPTNPMDLTGLRLLDSLLPPVWQDGGDARYLLGTDNQGRDLLSAMLYGLRISLSIGFISVGVAATIGILLGLISGFVGGVLDAFIMRVAEVQMSFPTIMIALLLDGVMRSALPEAFGETRGYLVVIVSMTLVYWVQYARAVRASVVVERNKEYVMAAQLIGRSSLQIMLRHILINVTRPVLVIATVNLAVAIITESTLSFLGVGIPATQPTLGSLIRIGNNYLFSGEWWIVLFPGLTLALLSISVNLVGDWLRDTLNPRLK